MASAICSCVIPDALISEMIKFQSMTTPEVSTTRNSNIRLVERQGCDYSNMSTLAERLIEAWTDKGWNKAELRRRAGLKPPSTLTELEAGAITHSPQLPAIANALGVEVLWLQYGRGPRRKTAQTMFGPIASQVASIVEGLEHLQQTELLHFVKLFAMKQAMLANEPASVDLSPPEDPETTDGDHEALRSPRSPGRSPTLKPATGSAAQHNSRPAEGPQSQYRNRSFFIVPWYCKNHCTLFRLSN